MELAGHRKRPVVGVEGGDAAADADRGPGERGVGIDGRDRDGAAARPGGARHVGARAFVTGCGNDHDAGAGGVFRGDGIGRVRSAEVGAEGHADHVRAVEDGPVDGFGHDIGGAGAAEDAIDVEAGLRRNSGSDPEVLGAVDRRVVRPGIGGAVGQDALSGRGAGRMGAVAVAVEWVAVRMRHGGRRAGRRAGVVVVADEVVAHRHLGAREGDGRAVGVGGGQRGVVSQPVGVVGRLAGSAEVGVVVVDAGVDDGDLDPDSGEAGRGPGLRSADERHALGQVGLVRRDEVDPGDAGHRRQSRDLGGLDVHMDTVIGVLHLADDHAAGLADRVHDRLLLGLHLAPPGISLGLGHGRAVVLRVADHARDGLVRHLDDHVHHSRGVDQRGQKLGIDIADVQPLEARDRTLRDCRGRNDRSENERHQCHSGNCATSHSTPPVELFVSGPRGVAGMALTDVLSGGHEPTHPGTATVHRRPWQVNLKKVVVSWCGGAAVRRRAGTAERTRRSSPRGAELPAGAGRSGASIAQLRPGRC